MKKLFLVSLLLVLLFINLTYAELKIEPESISIISYVNYEKIISNIKITNTFNFSIYNIHFDSIEDVTMPNEISKLESNESVDVEIRILTSGAYSRTLYSTAKFNFYSLISDDPEYHNISIFDSYFSPQSFSIEIGDFVRWNNYGGLIHTIESITPLDNPFEETIQVNGTTEIQFQTITPPMTIDYRDKDIFFHGYISITEKAEELTYNSDYDKELTFIISSRYNETTIEISIVGSRNYTLDYDGSLEELLEVRNIGINIIKNISLTASKWITFSENNFDISPNAKNYVTFIIEPEITDADQTNFTHILEIKAQGINSEEVLETIYVSIPYESDLESYISLSRDELIKKIEELKEVMKEFISEPNCPSNKPYFDTIQKKCISEGEMESRLIQYNYTQEEVATFLIKIKEGKDATETFVKYATPKLNNIETTLLVTIMPYLQDLQKLANKSMELAKQNREDIESRRSWRIFGWIIFIFTIIFAIVGGLIWYNNYRDKQSY